MLSVFRILSTYMVWRSIKDSVPLLSDKFRAVHQEYKRKLLGTKTNKTREEVCFSYTNNILGPMLGALFIRNAFGPDSKEKVTNKSGAQAASSAPNSMLLSTFLSLNRHQTRTQSPLISCLEKREPWVLVCLSLNCDVIQRFLSIYDCNLQMKENCD